MVQADHSTVTSPWIPQEAVPSPASAMALDPTPAPAPAPTPTPAPVLDLSLQQLRPIASSPSVTEPAPMMPEETPSSPGPDTHQLGRAMSRLNTMSTRRAETVSSATVSSGPKFMEEGQWGNFH